MVNPILTYIDIYAKITQIKYTVLKYPYSVDKYSRGSIVAVKKKLDWLTGSTVKEKDSFSPSAQHLYVDLKLDLKQGRSYQIDKNEIQSSVTNLNKDLECIYDTECILHSLFELFRTPKGARILVPTYGTDLYTYIGQAITELKCSAIETMLKYDIKKWEPRVKVLNVVVTPEKDNSTINIEIYIEIPEISVRALTKYKFDSITGKLEQLREY